MGAVQPSDTMEPHTLTLCTLLLILLYISIRRPPNFPPGLARLPVIGIVPKGSKPPAELWRNYKVLGFFMGNRPSVQINDFALAKDLFNREEWCGRNNTFVSLYLRADSGKSKGIIFTDGQEWTDQRRFALKHLKDFGFGRAGLEGVIQGEVEDLVKLLSKQEGKDFHMSTVFGIPVINILWSIVAGTRFETEDPKAQRMMSLLNRLFKGKFAVEYGLPWWGVFCSLLPGLNTRVRIIRELRTMFRESISYHSATRDPNHPRDFIDVYLAEIEIESESESERERGNFDRESLELTCLDLFKAGAETSSTTLLWCVLYLTKYQDVQTKAREEVERITGEERPGLQHSLPYCQAVIQEVQRLATVAPQTIPHRITKDVTVEGYDVPKDSVAFANLTCFMQSPDYWDQPEKFRPERFLERSPEGELRLVKKDQFVPYGLGRRVCMGESLARDTLKIFLATLLKHIRFDNPLSHPRPDTENFTDGFTVIPHPYFVNIKVVRKI